jgi:acetoin utilization protein AcuB
MYVKNCMTSDPVSIKPSEDINFAVHLLNRYGFKQLPVVKNELLVGIISDRDLRGVLDQPNLPIESVMTPEPTSILEDATVESAAQILRNRKINALPVLSKDGKLVGIITVTDIMDALIQMLRFHEEPERITLKMSKGVDLYQLIKFLQIYSEKVVSFTSAAEDNLTYYFWVIKCDYDKLDSKLKEKGIDVEIIHH